jgi:hypothetical protein
MLRSQILRLGGQCDDSSGAWGSFAKLVEGGAKLFGEKAASRRARRRARTTASSSTGATRTSSKLDLATRDFVGAQPAPRAGAHTPHDQPLEALSALTVDRPAGVQSPA